MYNRKLVIKLSPIIIIVLIAVFYNLWKTSQRLTSSTSNIMQTTNNKSEENEVKENNETSDKNSVFSKFTGQSEGEQKDRVADNVQKLYDDKFTLIVRSTIECQYNIDKQYPVYLQTVSPKCKLPTGIKLPVSLSNMKDYIPALKYKVSPDGQNYSFIVPATETTSYKATKNTWELLDNSEL